MWKKQHYTHNWSVEKPTKNVFKFLLLHYLIRLRNFSAPTSCITTATTFFYNAMSHQDVGEHGSQELSFSLLSVNNQGFL